eukprot:6479328-Amphidinium_carterae.1
MSFQARWNGSFCQRNTTPSCSKNFTSKRFWPSSFEARQSMWGRGSARISHNARAVAAAAPQPLACIRSVS